MLRSRCGIRVRFVHEQTTLKRHLNHFALRAQLYLKAIRVAYDELQTLKAA